MRCIIVTGGSRGLGAALVKQFATVSDDLVFSIARTTGVYSGGEYSGNSV